MLNWSTDYVKRQEFMKDLRIPTISETTDQVGESLAAIIFQECNEAMATAMGTRPPLYGPEGDLWVSPSDVLFGKICLKPPYDRRCLQALTHEGILAIGGLMEIKYTNYMKMLRDQALESLECYLKRMCEIEKIRVGEKVRAEEFKRYLIQIEALTDYYEQKILTIIEVFGWEMRQMLIQAAQDKKDLNIAWKMRMERELKKTVMDLTTEFLNKMHKQENILVNIFRYQVRVVQLKKKYEVEVEKARCKEALMQLKHNLECNNLSNMMYVLIKERKKCMKEKEEMEEYYCKEIKELVDNVACKQEKIKFLTKEKKAHLKELEIRSKCLKEVLEQFRKFVYFSLRETPTQAEYLLDIDKISKFVVDDWCVVPKKVPDKSKTIKEPGREEVVQAEEEEAKEEEERQDEVCICPVEQIPKVECVEEEFPVVYLKDKKYIREDFRDKEIGIAFNKNRMLWPSPSLIRDKTTVIQQIQQERASPAKHKIGSEKVPIVCPVHLAKKIEAKKITNYKIAPCKGKMGKPPEFDGKTVKDIITRKDFVNLYLRSTMMPKKVRECYEKEKEKAECECFTKLESAKDSVFLQLVKKEGESLKIPEPKTNVLDNIGPRENKFPAKTSKIVEHSDSLDLYRGKIRAIKPHSSEAMVSETTKKASKEIQVSNIISEKAISKKGKPDKHNQMGKFKRIVGDPLNLGHVENAHEFTHKRINSLVDLLKKDTDLMKLFAC